jgi:hypothetical protein
MNKYNIPVMFEKIEENTNGDSRFTKVKIWLMHTGKNHNGSDFAKKPVEDAIPSLEYIPIVGFIKTNSEGDEDFSQHKYILTKKDGEVVSKYIGSAYGVIYSTNDNDAHFESKVCDDGKTREFLVVKGHIWNQFEDSAEIMNRDLVKSHSMELDPDNVEGYEDEDGIFHFTKFSFRAACILGQDYEPGMESSTIEVQFDNNNIDFTKNIRNELETMMLEFMKEKQKGGRPLDLKEPNKTDFSLTNHEQLNEMSNVVYAISTTKDRWGDEVGQYFMLDIQGDEVICCDRCDNYNTYSFTFSQNGDKIIIDAESKKRKKIQYVDFEEGATTQVDGAFNFEKMANDFIETIDTLRSDKTSMANEYVAIKDKLGEIEPKYNDYVSKEKEQIEKETLSQKQALFEKFATSLSDNEDFTALKEKMNDYSFEELQGRCAVMFADKALNTDFSKNSNNADITLGIPDDIEGTDTYVNKRYGIISK